MRGVEGGGHGSVLGHCAPDSQAGRQLYLRELRGVLRRAQCWVLFVRAKRTVPQKPVLAGCLSGDASSGSTGSWACSKERLSYPSLLTGGGTRAVGEGVVGAGTC